MKRLTATIVLLSLIIACQGQEISKRQADSLSVALTKANSDVERMTILCQLAEYQIFKPGEYKTDLDSAEGFLNRAAIVGAKTTSAEANGFHALITSALMKERGQQQAGKAMAKKALDLLKTGTNKTFLAKTYFELSSYDDFHDSAQLSEKIRFLQSAADVYQQAGNLERQAFCQVEVADLYVQIDNDSKALQILNIVTQIYESLHYKKMQRVYVLYGTIYTDFGDYKQALKYCLMALHSAVSDGDTSMSTCEINNTIGIILNELKERTEALYYYRSALKVAEKYDDVSNTLIVAHNIVQDYMQLNRPDSALAFMKTIPAKFLQSTSETSYDLILQTWMDIYYALKKYPEAQQYGIEIMKRIKSNRPGDKALIQFYILLVKCYIATGQFAAADKYIQKVDSLSRKSRAFIALRADYYLRFSLDSAEHRYQSSVNSLLKYQQLNDSIYNETSSKQMRQLEIEYETKENEQQLQIKNKDITVLNQQNQIQQSHLRQANLSRNVTVAAIILVLIIAGLLYKQNTLKQKNNDLITLKNQQLQHLLSEKEWLLRELHHRVKNNLQVMMSLQELQARNLTSEEALTAVTDSSNRLYAMSLIHQKLYKPDGPDQINMRQYIGELVRHLADAFAPAKPIKLETDLTADIELDVTQAIPVGLILNEAITNVFKYAFAGRPDSGLTNAAPPPHLRIALYRISQTEIELVIKDNGRGYAADQDKSHRRSLGFSLMKALAEELEGNFDVLNEDGLTILLRFAPFKGKMRHNSVSLVAEFA